MNSQISPSSSNSARPTLTLAGMSPSTSNLGVDALLWSTLGGVARVDPSVAISVLDYGQGRRPTSFVVDGADLDVDLVAANASLRLHKPESLYRMTAEAIIGRPTAAGTRALVSSGALLDVSGGDSFTDLYGGRRFRQMTLSKLIALRARTPLYLLPQTYGPFKGRLSRKVARHIVRGAAQCWSRDPDGHQVLLELAGSDVDPSRLRAGVDMAFALGIDRRIDIDDDLAGVLESGNAIGINISGLCFNDADQAASFGFRLDYQAAAAQLLDWFLEKTDQPIVMVPHVGSETGFESDLLAARTLAAEHPEAVASGRLHIAPIGWSVREMKWLLSQFDWFVGTRMHATIGAISTGVPTATLAYSLKARGVFATCGAEHAVADARVDTIDEAMATIIASYEGRDAERARLVSAMPIVVDQAENQVEEIIRAALRAIPDEAIEG